MTIRVEAALRGPNAFDLAAQAMASMQEAKVWPTPLNYELWLHYLCAPDSPLATEMARHFASGDAFTESMAEMLAAEYLPRGRLSDQIRDAGAVLNRELTSVSEAISKAQKSQAAYGVTLADASATIDGVEQTEDLKLLVVDLSQATSQIQRENSSLEGQLERSTKEVARLRDHLEQVRRDAMTDALTNLSNRKAFDEELLRACSEAEDAGTPCTLAIIDIDNFKRFNDTWGHQTGDQVLRYVASVMANIAKGERVAARYGGEEFAMIFPNESLGVVEAAMNEIRKEIASRALRRRSTNDELGSVTISVGVAQRLHDETGSSLLDRADAALYFSKNNGRNLVTSAETMRRAA